jgi:predicted aldo/keto reductase-like oxidoreductase
MEYRPLGPTGLSVSLLGFGGMRIPNKPESDVTALLDRALALGVNYIDTAPGYGNSEELIGKALAGRDTRGIVFSTKTNAGSDADADAVRRRVEQSLQRMGIPQITVLQMWGINDRETAAKVLAKGGPLAGARRLQDEGLVRHVGFTTHALPEDALSTMETGEFVSVTGRYHYLDPVYDRVRERAGQLGLAFVAMTPLGQGWLARPSPALLDAIGGADPVAFALRHTATRPGLTTIIVGISAMEELEAAHAALGGELGDAQVLADRATHVYDRMIHALGGNYCTQCRQCLPCPENINIPELLRLNNLLQAYDLVDWCKDRYKFMGNAGNWYPGVKADSCTECGDCEPRCPEGLPIVDLLKALHEELYEGERGRLSQD